MALDVISFSKASKNQRKIAQVDEDVQQPSALYPYAEIYPKEYMGRSLKLGDTSGLGIDTTHDSEKSITEAIDKIETRIDDLDHNETLNKQGGDPSKDEYIHLSQAEKDKYDNYQVTLDDHEVRISVLEGTPLPAPPEYDTTIGIMPNPAVDLSAGVHTIQIPLIAYSGDAPILVLTNKVVSTPNYITNTPFISETGGVYYIEFDIDVPSGASFNIDILAGAVTDKGIANNNFPTFTYTVSGTVVNPIIGSGSLYSATDVDLGTTHVDPTQIAKIKFPITSIGTLTLLDGNKYQVSLNLSGAALPPLRIEGTSPNAELVLDLDNSAITKDFGLGNTYVKILQDCFSDDSLNNAGTVQTNFSTLPSTPIVGVGKFSHNLATIDGTDNVDHTLSTFKVQYPITTATGTKIQYFANAANIDINNGAGVVAKTATIINGSTLEITFTATPLIDDDVYTININPGAINNDSIDNTNTVSESFTTAEYPPIPIIQSSTICGTQVYANLGEIRFPVTGDYPILIQDLDIAVNNSLALTGAPAGTTVTVDNNVGTDNESEIILSLPALTPGATYNMNLGLGLIKFLGNNVDMYGATTNSAPLPCSFSVYNTPAFGDITIEDGTSSIGNNQTDVDSSNLSQIRVALTGGTNFNIFDSNKITSSNLTISNKQIVGQELILTIDNTSTTYSSSYSINIQAGAIEDDDSGLLTPNSLTINFDTKGETPVIGAMTPVSGSTLHRNDLFQLEFLVNAGPTHPGNNVIIGNVSGGLTGGTGSLDWNNATLTPTINTGEYTLTVPIGGLLDHNTTYSIELPFGTIVSDETESVLIGGYTFITSADFPTVTAPTEDFIDVVSNSYTFEFDLDQDVSQGTNFGNIAVLFNAAGSGSNAVGNGTKGTVTIDNVNHKLKVEVNNIGPSEKYDISIPIECVTNGTVSNDVTSNGSFISKGVSPSISHSSLNATTGVDPTTTSIVFPVVYSTNPINETFDDTQILCDVPNTITGSTYNSTTNEITVNVNLVYDQTYNFTLGNDTIKADETSSSGQNDSFQTAASGSGGGSGATVINAFTLSTGTNNDNPSLDGVAIWDSLFPISSGGTGLWGLFFLGPVTNPLTTAIRVPFGDLGTSTPVDDFTPDPIDPAYPQVWSSLDGVSITFDSSANTNLVYEIREL